MQTRSTLVALCLLLGVAALPSLAAGEADGKKVFLDANCNMCHAVPRASIEAKTKSEKMKGPDLLANDPKFEAAWLAKYLRGEEGKEGKSHKKDFKGSDEELQALVDWLLEQKAEG